MLTVGCMLYLASLPLVYVFLALNRPGASHAELGPWGWWAALLEQTFQSGEAVALLALLILGMGVCLRGLWKAFGGTRVTIARLMLGVFVVAVGLALGPIGLFLMLVAPVPLTLVALVRNRPDFLSRGRRGVREIE